MEILGVEKTLSIIKPDAVKNVIGEIYTRFEKGLKIVVKICLFVKMQNLYREKKKGVFNDLVKFMTSGPVMVRS